MEHEPMRRIQRPPPAGDVRPLGVILWHVLTRVDAKPLPPPSFPEDFAQLPMLVKMQECLRLAVLDVEYALCPRGHFRGLLRLLLRLVVLIDACLLAAAAVLAAITPLTALAALISDHLRIIAINCLITLLAVLACAVVLIVFVWLITRVNRR